MLTHNAIIQTLKTAGEVVRAAVPPAPVSTLVPWRRDGAEAAETEAKRAAVIRTTAEAVAVQLVADNAHQTILAGALTDWAWEVEPSETPAPPLEVSDDMRAEISKMLDYMLKSARDHSRANSSLAVRHQDARGTVDYLLDAPDDRPDTTGCTIRHHLVTRLAWVAVAPSKRQDVRAVLDVENAVDALRDLEKLLAALAGCGFQIDPAGLEPVCEALATRLEDINTAIAALRAQVVQ